MADDKKTSRVRINPRDTKTPPKGQDSRVRINLTGKKK